MYLWNWQSETYVAFAKPKNDDEIGVLYVDFDITLWGAFCCTSIVFFGSLKSEDKQKGQAYAAFHEPGGV